MVPNHLSTRRSQFLSGRITLGVCGLCLFLFMPLSVAQNADAPAKRDSTVTSAAAANKTASATDDGEPLPKSGKDDARADAKELSALANKLRDQLQDMNINVFSFGVEEKTEAIQKLVRKIKAEGNER